MWWYSSNCQGRTIRTIGIQYKAHWVILITSIFVSFNSCDDFTHDICILSLQVIFVCGDKHDIVNVTEPSTCNYHMRFISPYVCHRDSMLVYPTLSEELQGAWDELEGELYREELTQKVIYWARLLHFYF